MQIHELTSRRRTDENFMSGLTKAAKNVARTVTEPVGQLAAQLKDPKAWVSTRAATAAKGGAILKQQTARYAEQLAGEWAQQSKQLVGAEAKAKMAGAKQTPVTTPPATTPPADKTKTTSTKKTKTTKPAPTDKTSAGANAFGQMTNVLGGTSGKTSTGGTATPLTTGVRHTASTTNPNQPQPAVAPDTTTTEPAAPPPTGGAGAFGQMAQTVTEPKKKGTRMGKVPSTTASTAPEEPISIGGQKLNPKNPKDAKLIAQLKAKGLQEAFADLPGAKPAAGGAVDPKVTAPVGRQGNPLTSAYITAFKKWSDAKLATRESNTGETITMQSVTKEFPEIARGLNQALVNIYNTRQDPKSNEQAVTAYLTQAVTAIQKVAAQKRQENPKSAARGKAASAPGQMDPQTAKLASAMGLAQTNLNKMKQVIDSQAEKVTQGTGSKTIDNLLVAAGLLK